MDCAVRQRAPTRPTTLLSGDDRRATCEAGYDKSRATSSAESLAGRILVAAPSALHAIPPIQPHLDALAPVNRTRPVPIAFAGSTPDAMAGTPPSRPRLSRYHIGERSRRASRPFAPETPLWFPRLASALSFALAGG